ncbi:MAG TPA: hypothetical protein VKW06_08120 [Candidatus Angelobacter sp.]|nr:hypothetical protein [Candidatus Angelobacter sp.]
MIHWIHLRLPVLSLAAFLCCALKTAGQVQVGDEVQLGLDGNLSAAYAGSYTNEGPSSHGMLFGGNGNLNGSFYSPQFLSFTISPFYNQSRNSSSFSSINDSTGLTARANVFGGSQFPGYISYSRIYNNESDYLIPGITNFKTNGNNETLGVGWSLNFKNLPSFTVGYQQGNSDSTLYGTQTDSLTNFRSVFGNANYLIDGSHLSGGVHYSSGTSEFPEIVPGQPLEKTSSDTITYTANASHPMPLSGSTWINFTRNSAGYDSAGLSSSQTADILSGGVTLKPTSQLSTQISADYNDSLAGTLYQLAGNSGVLAPVSIPAGSSHSWGLVGQAQYTVAKGLYVAGGVSHREQLFLGVSYDSTSYSGSVNYGHRFLGGQFSTGATVTHSSLSNTDESQLGLLTNATYIRQIGGWNVSGSLNYSQNVQTLVVAFTTSGYGYSTSVSRRLGRLNWSGSAAGSKTLLTQPSGTSNFMQNYSTGLSGRWLGATVGYSKSSGTGLFTGSGISNLPVGVPVQFLPTAVLFAGTTYSAGLGSTPIGGLTVNANYLRAENTTANGVLSSSNRTDQANAYLIYKFRKIYFNAGYSRLLQGFSASGLPPTLASSYYFGISRWFKFF